MELKVDSSVPKQPSPACVETITALESTTMTKTQLYAIASHLKERSGVLLCQLFVHLVALVSVTLRHEIRIRYPGRTMNILKVSDVRSLWQQRSCKSLVQLHEWFWTSNLWLLSWVARYLHESHEQVPHVTARVSLDVGVQIAFVNWQRRGWRITINTAHKYIRGHFMVVFFFAISWSPWKVWKPSPSQSRKFVPLVQHE